MHVVETKRSRILSFDILRGFFLLVILIDHLNYPTYFYEILSGRGSLFASAAEGFFLISGLLVGYLFVEKMQHKPKDTTIRLLKRAGVLYGWSIGLTIIFTILGYIFTVFGGVKSLIWPAMFSETGFVSFVWHTFTLQYVYGWADFLAHYVVFMLAAPLVVWLTAHGKAWLAVLASVAVWWFGHDSSFNAAWQLLFMLGIVGGYYLPHIESWWKQRPYKLQYGMFATLVTLSVISILFSAAVSIFAPYVMSKTIAIPALLPIAQQLTDFGRFFGTYVDKDSLEYGRLIFAILWFVTAYLVVRVYEKNIIKYTKNFFNTIGARSLYVYGLQAFIIFFVHILIQNSTHILLNFIVVSGAITLTYMAARYYPFIAKIPRIAHDKFKQRKAAYAKTSY